MTEKTVRDYRLQANRYVRPVLGSRTIGDVTRADVERVMRRIGSKPVQRNRVLALLNRLFNVFETWELRPQHSNPCRGVEKAREEARDRVLTDDERRRLAEVLVRAGKRYRGTVGAIRCAFFSGLRIGEILAMRWDDVDMERSVVTLPNTKTGRRQHNMPAVAMEVIRDQPQMNDFVFSNGGKSGIVYRTVRGRFEAICTEAGIEGVRLHDLRRSFMTLAAESGANAYQIRQLLGHRSSQAAERYVRAIETRDLGDQVADRILEATK